jgi:hypothetical protein
LRSRKAKDDYFRNTITKFGGAWNVSDRPPKFKTSRCRRMRHFNSILDLFQYCQVKSSDTAV